MQYYVHNSVPSPHCEEALRGITRILWITLQYTPYGVLPILLLILPISCLWTQVAPYGVIVCTPYIVTNRTPYRTGFTPNGSALRGLRLSNALLLSIAATVCLYFNAPQYACA